jgi:hypothetical protein
MQIGRHHFFENLFAALRANDRNLAKNILITELANQIIANPFTVREILAENGVAVSQNATSEEIANLLIDNIPSNKGIRSKIVDLIFNDNKLSFDGEPHYDRTNKNIKWELVSGNKNKTIISELLKEAMLEEKSGKLSTDIIPLTKQVKNKAKLFAFTPPDEALLNPEELGFGFGAQMFVAIAFIGVVAGAFTLWYRNVEKKTD